jgi:hypothetical protein
LWNAATSTYTTICINIRALAVIQIKRDISITVSTLR